MRIYMTNTTEFAKTLKVGEPAAEWTRIGGGIAEGLSEDLAANTRRARVEMRLHLLEAAAREYWDELNQAETECRFDDSEATSSGVQDSDSRKAAHGGASSTFRKEPDKRAQADTARRQPFTGLPSEECLSAQVDGMETLPPDPPPGSSREVIRAAFDAASKALMSSDPGDEGPWSNKISRLLVALAKSDTPGSRGSLVLPECMNLDETLQHLSPEDRELVRASLTTQADFFATQQYPKRISGMEPIDIDTGSHQQRTVNDYVEKLLDAGIVEPGDGPWSYHHSKSYPRLTASGDRWSTCGGSTSSSRETATRCHWWRRRSTGSREPPGSRRSTSGRHSSPYPWQNGPETRQPS
jgi:hypothetical protein